MPRVLLILPNHEDYLADGLFHGLRTLLGPDCVDWPKNEPMYRGYPPEWHARLRGGGFTLYGLLDDAPVERFKALYRAVEGEFDLVVFGDIWRSFGLWTEWGPQLADAGVPLAVLDGSDRVEPYPYAGLWWRRRSWWFLPRVDGRARQFKREITPLTWWFRSYLALPPAVARRMGILGDLREIAFSIPEEKIVTAPAAKDQEFARHVVDPEVAPLVGGQTAYAFSDEAAYRADLERSRFAVTTKRAGWDCLRHYEIAAAGTVPCFRDLAAKPPRCAPHGLDDGNCIPYEAPGALLERTAAIGEQEYDRLREGALAWARRNTTVARAREFLAACGLDAS